MDELVGDLIDYALTPRDYSDRDEDPDQMILDRLPLDSEEFFYDRPSTVANFNTFFRVHSHRPEGGSCVLMHVNMYICIYVYMYVCMYACMVKNC
jgi:hypothetical protein